MHVAHAASIDRHVSILPPLVSQLLSPLLGDIFAQLFLIEVQLSVEETSDTRAEATSVLISTQRGGSEKEGDRAVVASVNLVELLAGETETGTVDGTEQVEYLQVDLGGELDKRSGRSGA